MPKERIRSPKKAGSGRTGGRPGPAARAHENGARIVDQSGNTRIDTLRRTYGDSFAPGIRGDAHLQTLLSRTGSSSLSGYLKATGQSAASGAEGKDRANDKPAVRYADAERFNAAHRKTSSLHAGLFRRLAE